MKQSTAKGSPGASVILALQKKLSSPSLLELASELGITNQAVQNWRKRKVVTPRQIASLVDKVRAAARRRTQSTSIRPIVEFFPITRTPSKQEAGYELFSDLDDEKNSHPYLAGLKKELRQHHGVYIFFDSRGHAIYAGKARRQRLWRELKHAFNRKRDDLQKIRRVKHPSRRLQYKTSNENPGRSLSCRYLSTR